MSPIPGRHHRRHRLAAAHDQLHDMPDGMMLTLRKAARLLGTTEPAVRRLVATHVHAAAVVRNMVSVATLREVVRMQYQARWPH